MKIIYFMIVFLICLSVVNCLNVSQGEEDNTYILFDYKNFCDTYENNMKVIPGAQTGDWAPFNRWFDMERKKYVGKHIESSGFVYRVDKEERSENYYVELIPENEPSITHRLTLRKLDKKKSLSLKKGEKISFLGKVVQFDKDMFNSLKIDVGDVSIRGQNIQKEKIVVLRC